MLEIAELPIVIASMSLGRAWVHSLSTKLDAAKAAGFKGIEVFWEDLVYAAKEYVSIEDRNDLARLEMNEQAMLRAAQFCRELCDERGLFVLDLQPFMNYDGLLDDERHRAMIRKLELWFKIAKVLETDMIQVPSQMLAEGTTGDTDKLVADLTEIAEMGLQQQPPIRFAYEAMAWGVHVNLWDQSWDIVKRVNLPNFGLVIDTYHILSLLYGDPTLPSGIRPTGPEDLDSSLKKLSALGPEILPKIFYIQLSDAELLDPPLHPEHELCLKNPGMDPRMIWSRNARLFPCEDASEDGTFRGSGYGKKGYLPVSDVAKVLFENIGYRGVVSLESFSLSMTECGAEVPKCHAEKGMSGWKKLLKELAYL